MAMEVNKALSALLDHACEVWKRPAKTSCWADFFPSILVNERTSKGAPKGQEETVKYAASKCSRYHKRELRLLRKELEQNGAATIAASGVKLPEPLQGIDPDIYQVAWYVRWIVRSPASQYREPLLRPACYEYLFDKAFIDEFIDGLREDFYASQDELDHFASVIADMCGRDKADEKQADFAWPQQLDQSFVESVAAPVSFNYYADLFCMMLLASLYGPMDYRWEFGYLNKRVLTKQTASPLSSFAQSAQHNGNLPVYARLTRVTYDARSIDERDYLTCPETVSLKGLKAVRIGRALPSRLIGDTAYVSLIDEHLSSYRQAEVSKCHARLARSNGDWVLRDWDSKSGTLVVTRDGDRFVVGGKGNESKSRKLESGDILCFAHNEMRAVADLPCYLFHLCVDTKGKG